jgi:hypothetical protein
VGGGIKLNQNGSHVTEDGTLYFIDPVEFTCKSLTNELPPVAYHSGTEVSDMTFFYWWAHSSSW